MDIEPGMIEATTTPPPMGIVSTGVVSTGTMMITTTVAIGVMTAMDIAVKAATAAAEEVYTSVA